MKQKQFTEVLNEFFEPKETDLVKAAQSLLEVYLDGGDLSQKSLWTKLEKALIKEGDDASK